MHKSIQLAFLLLLSACANDAPPDFPAEASVDAQKTNSEKPEGIRLAEAGHQKADFIAKKTISFDLHWNQRRGLRAQLTQRFDGSNIHIRYASGTEAWWDGRTVRLQPAAGDTITETQARFDLRAWHYWSCLPYKLSDPGVRWQALPDRNLDNRVCSVGKLSFNPGTGDTPEDWFAVFTDRKEGLVRAAVFVATVGHESVRTAAKTPQMIRYLDYRIVDGIPVAHRWVFTGWETERLNAGADLGEVIFSNVRFGAGF